MSWFGIAATCELCEARIEAEEQIVTTTDAAAREIGRHVLMAYDKLATKMWLHIMQHHPLQSQEGMLAQVRAAKMYAMNWAKIDPSLDHLRKQYRAELIIAMSVTTRVEDQAAGGSGPEPSPEPPKLELSN